MRAKSAHDASWNAGDRLVHTGCYWVSAVVDSPADAGQADTKQSHGTVRMDKTKSNRDQILITSAQQLRADAPTEWTVAQKNRAFGFLGPAPQDNSQRARLLVWLDDVSIESGKLRKRNNPENEIGQLDNTQIGRVFVSRNNAAEKF